MQHAIIMLAAGFSRRFGSDKRLSAINGNPMLLATLHNLQAAMKLVPDTELRVVIRPRDPIVAPMLVPMLANAQSRLLHAPVWPVGFGASIAVAMDNLLRGGGNPESVAICPADLPFVEPDTLAILLQESDRDSICVPVCAGCRGLPIVVGRKYFATLSRLRGKHGLEKLLRIFPDAVRDIAVRDPAIHCDINSPEDFHAAMRQGQFDKMRLIPDTALGEQTASQ